MRGSTGAMGICVLAALAAGCGGGQDEGGGDAVATGGGNVVPTSAGGAGGAKVDAGGAGGAKVDAGGSGGAKGGAGGAKADSGGAGGARTYSDGAVGVWEDISPQALDYQCGGSNFGILSVVGGNVDAPHTFYIGTGDHSGKGIWKSSDDGDTWWKVSGDQIGGSNGSLTLDFTDSDVLYTGQLYGGDMGIRKSSDGGVTWKQIATTAGMNNDINAIAMDPTDHLHLVAAPHSGTPQIYETFDGGSTWAIHGALPFGIGILYFLDQDDAGSATGSAFIFQSVSDGTWRSTTGGRVGGTAGQRYRDGAPGAAAWTHVSTLNKTHGASAIARLASGSILMAVETTVARSDDNGKTWIDMAASAGKGGNLPTCGDASAGLANDGTHVWTMRSNTGCSTCGSYPVDFPATNNACSTKGFRWLVTPTDGDGTNWTEYNTQSFQDGPADHMLYAPLTRTVYSPNWCTGAFRLRLP